MRVSRLAFPLPLLLRTIGYTCVTQVLSNSTDNIYFRKQAITGGTASKCNVLLFFLLGNPAVVSDNSFILDIINLSVTPEKEAGQ